NKGYESDKSVATLNKLDLFPTWFKVKGTPEQHGDDKATGTFTVEDKEHIKANLTGQGKVWDLKMFENALVPSPIWGPYGLQEGKVELVKEGGLWKLNITLAIGQS